MSECKIKETREGFGLTKEEVQQALEMPMRTLNSYERGERKPAPWVEKLIIKAIVELGKKKVQKYNDFAEKMEDNMK